MFSHQITVATASYVLFSLNTGPQGPPFTTVGAYYIRWGRTNCTEGIGTELLHTGRAAGTFYLDQGGGSQFICLPDELSFDVNETVLVPGEQSGRSKIYGAEYEISELSPDLQDFGVPCAACYTPERGSKIMLPARNSCPASWTVEYNGFLVSERFDYHRLSYECLDADPEPIPGTGGNEDGPLFHLAEMECSAPDCPNYEEGRELSCVVCTK